MKALSIRQPWCEAILKLGKRVENRDWQGCSYRGPVLLHASKTLVLRNFDSEIESIIEIIGAPIGQEEKAVEGLSELRPMGGHGRRARWCPAPRLPLGGIVGRANIVDVLHMGGVPASRMAAKDRAETGASPWYAGGFALVLTNVEPLPFVPWRGALGLFDVPDDLLRPAEERARRDAAQ